MSLALNIYGPVGWGIVGVGVFLLFSFGFFIISVAIHLFLTESKYSRAGTKTPPYSVGAHGDNLNGAHGDNLDIVADKVFRNTSIVLDGHKYTHCKFYYVTIKFNGGDFVFSNNEIYGGVRFASDNIDITKAFGFIARLGVLKVPIFDQNGKIIEAGMKFK